MEHFRKRSVNRRQVLESFGGLAGGAAVLGTTGTLLPIQSLAQTPVEGIQDQTTPQAGTINIVDETFGQEAWLVHLSASITTGPQQPIYEWLLYYDPENTFDLLPGLAESWSHEDLKKWTFNIRQGVEWDQGNGEVTAEDVAYTLELISRDDAVSTDTPYWRPRIEFMEVTDPHTLTFNFDTVEPVVAYHLSNWRRTQIMSKAYIEAVGEDQANREPVGSGPYRLGEYTQGSRVELLAIDRPHWRIDPMWERMVFQNVGESSTRMAMLETGDADLVLSDMEQIDNIESDGFDSFTSDAISQFSLFFGGLFRDTHPNYQGDAPWHDLRVREAMAIAIDRQAINEAFFNGVGTYEATPGNNVAPLETVADMPMSYDAERARMLLAEAGHEDFAPEIISFVYPGITQMPQIIEAVASYWEEIGLRPTITPMDRLAFRELWLADETNGLMWGWGNPVQPLFEARVEKFFYSEDIGFQIYTDEYMDQVFNDLLTLTDADARTEMLADAQVYLREQWAAIHLMNVPSMLFAARPDVVASWSPMRAGESTTWEYIAPGTGAS